MSLASPSASFAAAGGVPQLDFEALLSRKFVPSRVVRLIPREAYRPPHHDHHNRRHHHRAATATAPSSSASSDSDSGSESEGRKKIKKKKNHKSAAAAARLASSKTLAVVDPRRQETSRLVLSLVSQTPNFLKHLPEGAAMDSDAMKEARLALAMTVPPPAAVRSATGPAEPQNLPSKFHEIELGDWESKIDWGDGQSKEPRQLEALMKPTDPMELLRKKRNPLLDSLEFDDTTVCWDGNDVRRLLEKSRSAPLILELGVAGRSVARHVYQNTVLSAQRPPPALQSNAYAGRVERDYWSSQGGGSGIPVASTAGVSSSALGGVGGSLHADKERLEALIEARQHKRAQMAKDKTSRVTQAMGTLALGGGRGRTITSSLMGPGGTERTGRPARGHQAGWMLSGYESQYVEQLDLVVSHSLVRDLSKVMLREFHRPKLPPSVVRPNDLAWQFQIRYFPGAAGSSSSAGKKGKGEGPSAAAGGGGAGGVSGSYQSVMMGGGAAAQPGAVSKAKLRTEADLSPTEGKLILVEYCEERPLLQLGKGMAFKIVNYYRGDKSRCPVSRGGGDRPARRKRPGVETSGDGSGEGGRKGSAGRRGRGSGGLARLEGPRETSVLDWVGELPKRKPKDRAEKEAIDILPEGVTEILHPKVHGPFIGEVEEGTTLTGLISNLFVAPMFRHEPEQTDFLMILTPPGGAARPGHREAMGVVLRDLPSSVFTVGQTEPRTRVYAPNTNGEKNFVGPFISYQIAKALTRSELREGHGLRFDEIQDRVLPNLDIAANALRQRLKQVAVYDKNTQIWTTKAIGYEDYPGVDALGKSISPESVAAFETATAATRRLADLGIHQLCTGSHIVASVGVTMVYLVGQVNAARELARKSKKLLELSRTNRSITAEQIKLYEKAAAELDAIFKVQRQKYEIAQFIYEELQLTPWHLTGEFIDVHKKGEGTGMLKLTGLGDPSGTGAGFSFLREVEKPAKAVGQNQALNNQIKKITGTDDDLRKLTMKQMASLLRSYGMAQKEIDTLKRWDRVHVIRDLSTKAASDGIGDGLERFARGEKMKLAEQKQMYRDRVQTIWGRQIAWLSSDAFDKAGVSAVDASAPSTDGDADLAGSHGAQAKKAEVDKDSSDDSDDDDFAAALEDEMMDRAETNQLVAAHAGGADNAALGQLRAATQDQDLSKDARDLAALKRQREEERAAQEGFQTLRPADERFASAPGVKRKVIKKIIRKTHPDGRQTTTFKFILHPEEVGVIMARKEADEQRPRLSELKFDYAYGMDEKPPGHSMFEDEDDFEYSSKGRLMSNRRRGLGNKKNRTGPGGRAPTVKPRTLQIGKLKTKISKEERMRKRKREEEELEVYVATAKRKGAANNRRRERGSIREHRPHVKYAEKLEGIRASVEAREFSVAFHKPVSRKLLPRYYELISHPIDLSTIRDKISRYEYRTVDAFVRDFELMKNNAVKFNGPANHIAQEAVAIYEFVRDQVDSFRPELRALEEQVDELMNAKPKKRLKSSSGTAPMGPGSSAALGRGSAASGPGGGSHLLASVGGHTVNLGNLGHLRNIALAHGADEESDDDSEASVEL